MVLKIIERCGLGSDRLMGDILGYIVVNGPATAYRIARDMNIHFAQAYRKVKRLERFRLVRRIDGRRGDVFEATVRGLVACYYYSCADRRVVAARLARGVDREVVSRFLDAYFQYAGECAPVDDLPLMVFYAVSVGVPMRYVADLLPLLRPICSIVSAAVPEIETAK
ncbi:MAG: ArsR family transcriptional regulator [Thermoproteus sp.]